MAHFPLLIIITRAFLKKKMDIIYLKNNFHLELKIFAI